MLFRGIASSLTPRDSSIGKSSLTKFFTSLFSITTCQICQLSSIPPVASMDPNSTRILIAGSIGVGWRLRIRGVVSYLS